MATIGRHMLSVGVQHGGTLAGNAMAHQSGASSGVLAPAHDATPRGRLEGEVAVVTGAGSGIGAATADLFAREGASVVCVDLNPTALASTASRIVAAGGIAPLTLCVDMGDEMAVKDIGPHAVARFGRVSILVNIAGIRDYDSVVDASEEQWDRLLGTNLKGYAWACKHLLPVMEAHGRGSVVNISSVFGVAKARAEMPIYDATKAGVVSLTRSLAIAHGPAIRVNALCPGFVITEYHLARAKESGLTEDEYRAQATSGDTSILQRPADPTEIARAILFLSCSDASFVTGSVLMVDGGLHTR